MEPEHVTVLGFYNVTLALIPPELTKFFKVFCSTYFLYASLVFGRGAMGARSRRATTIVKAVGVESSKEFTRLIIKPLLSIIR
jgi:hypothetical protein